MPVEQKKLCKTEKNCLFYSVWQEHPWHTAKDVLLKVFGKDGNVIVCELLAFVAKHSFTRYESLAPLPLKGEVSGLH